LHDIAESDVKTFLDLFSSSEGFSINFLNAKEGPVLLFVSLKASDSDPVNCLCGNERERGFLHA